MTARLACWYVVVQEDSGAWIAFMRATLVEACVTPTFLRDARHVAWFTRPRRKA